MAKRIKQGFRLRGLKEVIRNLRKLDEVGQRAVRRRVAMAMGFALLNHAVPEAPVVSGTLRRSGTVEEHEDGARAGFGVVYARRIHEGFSGKDSRGRNYNQPGNPFIIRGARSGRRDMIAEAEAELRPEFRRRTL